MPTRRLLVASALAAALAARAAPASGDASCLAPYAGGALLADPGAPALSAPGPLFARFGEPLHLCLAGPLRASRRFEIKLSFREPDARLRVRLIAAAGAPGGGARAPPGAPPQAQQQAQQLLLQQQRVDTAPELKGAVVEDAEKLEFATDAEGRIVIVESAADAGGDAAGAAVPVERVLLRIEAAPRGPRRADLPAPGGVWLDARLDELDFGIVPRRARALIVAVPLALLCAACAAHGLLHSPYSPLRLASVGKVGKRMTHGE